MLHGTSILFLFGPLNMFVSKKINVCIKLSQVEQELYRPQCLIWRSVIIDSKGLDAIP